MAEDIADMDIKVDAVTVHNVDKEQMVVTTVITTSKQTGVTQDKHGEDPSELGHQNRITVTEGE